MYGRREGCWEEKGRIGGLEQPLVFTHINNDTDFPSPPERLLMITLQYITGKPSPGFIVKLDSVCTGAHSILNLVWDKPERECTSNIIKCDSQEKRDLVLGLWPN